MSTDEKTIIRDLEILGGIFKPNQKEKEIADFARVVGSRKQKGGYHNVIDTDEKVHLTGKEMNAVRDYSYMTGGKKDIDFNKRIQLTEFMPEDEDESDDFDEIDTIDEEIIEEPSGPDGPTAGRTSSPDELRRSMARTSSYNDDDDELNRVKRGKDAKMRFNSFATKIQELEGVDMSEAYQMLRALRIALEEENEKFRDLEDEALDTEKLNIIESYLKDKKTLDARLKKIKYAEMKKQLDAKRKEREGTTSSKPKKTSTAPSRAKNASYKKYQMSEIGDWSDDE